MLTERDGINLKPIFAPSLMCMDYLHVEDDLRILNEHCDMLHADIMDGHFAPNLALSTDFLRGIRPAATLPIDAHLMVENPADYVEPCALSGARYISVHAETVWNNAFRVMNQIKKAGCLVGLVLSPATTLDAAKHLLPYVDILTVMTVDVGYAGQAFIPEMLGKIRDARRLKEEQGYSFIIQSDGGCGPKTYADLYAAGAQAFVLGSSGLFGRAPDLETACRKLKSEFDEAVAAGGQKHG